MPPNTSPEYDPEVPAPTGVPPYRSVSLVLEADGRLRSIIRATDHDAPLPFEPGMPLSTVMVRLAGGAGRAGP